MATDVEITEPKLSVFVPVPRAAEPGVCRVCHGPAGERGQGVYWPTCWNCRDIPHGGARIVAPLSLVHTSESQLYVSLRDYKNERLAASVRGEHRLLLAAALQRFVRIHRSHIEGASGVAWNTITIVPSTRNRDGEHPLFGVIRCSPILRAEFSALLTWTGHEVGHNRPNPEAFAAAADAGGRRVLLVDDTFTTGARVQSAAAALTSAGARVVGAVPIGRVVDTNRSEKEAFWRRQRGTRFDFAVCCLE